MNYLFLNRTILGYFTQLSYLKSRKRCNDYAMILCFKHRHILFDFSKYIADEFTQSS